MNSSRSLPSNCAARPLDISPLPVELEDDQLPSDFFRGSVQLLEKVNEVSIKFDGRGSQWVPPETILHSGHATPSLW